MSIAYGLVQNYLTAEPNDFTARVSPKNTLDLDDIIDRMVERGSTVVRPDILSVLDDFYSAVEQELLVGNFVNTPGCNYRVSIKGVFNGRTDTFDAARHQIKASAVIGQRIRQCIASQGGAEKVSVIKPAPILDEYFDINTAERNSVLTPLGMGELRGQNLKFDMADANQGIFFVAADNTETRVTIAGRIMPTHLMFLIPELPAGEYTLLVRSLWRESEIRKGELTEVLTVS